MIKILFSITTALTIFTLACEASAQGLYDHVKKKGEAKRSSRWTLEEWLAQKDRNRMMDLWLSMNSASPYEFYVGGEHLSYTDTQRSPSPETKESYVSSRLRLGAFSSIVGLEGEYSNNAEQNYSDLTGMLSLRIFGNAVQSTNITISYGNRNRHLPGVTMLRQQFGQVSLNLYFLKSFGLEGLYRGYIPMQNDSLGDINTSRWEAGVFVDFDFLRVYGNYFNEEFKLAPDTTPDQEQTQTGVQSGIKIFF